MLNAGENGFLLACARSCLAGNTWPGRRPNTGRLDWHYLLRTAELNDLSPILHEALNRQQSGIVAPDWACKELRGAYYAAGARNARLHQELKAVLDGLARSGVEPILLKGAALAETVWGNIALRPMSDLDLLVRETDLVAADAVLRQLRYELSERRYSAEWYLHRHHHLAPYHNRGNGAIVELHRGLVSPNSRFRTPISEVWGRARRIQAAGAEALVLSPEDQLIHLCLHVSADDPFNGKVKSLLDIPRVVRHYAGTIDWEVVVERTLRWHCARFIYYPLYLTDRRLGAVIGEGVLSRLRRACGLASAEDRLLKLIADRSILRRERHDELVPAWVLQRACESLLDDGLPSRKCLSLLGAIVPAALNRIRRAGRRRELGRRRSRWEASDDA